MFRLCLSVIAIVLSVINVAGQGRSAVVADSVSGMPLQSASVFDSRGKVLGMSDAKGRLPYIPADAYPVTVRFLGYNERTVYDAAADTVFLTENIAELPEMVVESRRHKVMHMLAYVREYSTMTTYTDTVFLFREKMVDFMLTPDDKVKFKGWSRPRVLTCKSYYRFTDNMGLDSVSDVSRHHFSWSDWIGAAPAATMPEALIGADCAADTLRGRYSPAEIWTRRGDRVSVDVNVLADTVVRRWVPDLSGFFRHDLDFEQFKLHYNFGNVSGEQVNPMDLTAYSYNIESNGRGHSMFRFNRVDEPFFVSTYAEVYIVDKEFITVKEARKWDKRKFDFDKIGIYEPMDAPELQPSILELISRVDGIDRQQIRLEVVPDERLVAKFDGSRNFKVGQRALFMLKQLTGISYYKSHKNFNKKWKEVKDRRPRRKQP